MRKILWIALLFAAVPAFAQGKSPVVIELFTSQSCASCPPAEEYLGALALRDDVIAVGCHVDYWDYLHWKDTFSQAYCSARQKEYRTAMGTQHIYTPQMVVNGRAEVNGTDQAAVNQAIADTAPFVIKPVNLRRKGETLTIALPRWDAGAATIYVFEYAQSGELMIPTGENIGLTVANTNPVLHVQRLVWDGKAGTIQAIVSKDTDGVAVIVNEDTLGPVIAAGKL